MKERLLKKLKDRVAELEINTSMHSSSKARIIKENKNLIEWVEDDEKHYHPNDKNNTSVCPTCGGLVVYLSHFGECHACGYSTLNNCSSCIFEGNKGTDHPCNVCNDYDMHKEL